MLLCIDGEACHPSVDLKDPDSLPAWQRGGTQQLLGGCTKWSNLSDVFTVFADLTSVALTGLCFDLFFPPSLLFPTWKDGKVWISPSEQPFSLFSCLFFSSLLRSASRKSLVLFFGTSSLVFWPLSSTSFPDQTCFLPSPPPLPTPLHCLPHCFATLSSSFPLFFLPLPSLLLPHPHYFTFQLDSLHAIFSL